LFAARSTKKYKQRPGEMEAGVRIGLAMPSRGACPRLTGEVLCFTRFKPYFGTVRSLRRGRSAMSIRWKFLLILLGFSLTPLLVFGVLNYRVSLGLGEDLGDISRRLILYTAHKELQDDVENYARNFSREMRLAEDVLRVYASAVENEVASLSPAGGAQTRAHALSKPDS
jgi:hypothetical protein